MTTRNRKQEAIAGALLAAATAWHAYDRHLFTGGHFDVLFFVWAMAPYVACLIVLVSLRIAALVIAASATALALDVWTTYAVRTSTSSTAVLDYMWMPIWNLIIVVPAAMGVTLLVIRFRERRSKREV